MSFQTGEIKNFLRKGKGKKTWHIFSAGAEPHNKLHGGASAFLWAFPPVALNAHRSIGPPILSIHTQGRCQGNYLDLEASFTFSSIAWTGKTLAVNITAI